MTTTTLTKRLSKINVSKSSKAYHAVAALAGLNESTMVEGNLIRPCYTLGSGRYTSNNDHSFVIQLLLNKLGVKYTTGNDAPRGGACGKYIKILNVK